MTRYLLTIMLAGGMLFAGTVQGAVLLDDDFSDNPDQDALIDLSRLNLPDTTQWFRGSGGGTATTTAASGALLVTGSTANSSHCTITAQFGGHTLEIGEILHFDFDIRFISARTDDDGAVEGTVFRMGLFDSGGNKITANSTSENGTDSNFDLWDGYSLFADFVGAHTLRNRTGTGDLLLANGQNTELTSGTDHLAVGVDYEARFSVERNADGVLVSVKIGDIDISDYAVTADPVYTFDSFHIWMWSGTTGGEDRHAEYEIDNVKVSVIPEPATMTLLGFGGLMALARRRRRRA